MREYLYQKPIACLSIAAQSTCYIAFPADFGVSVWGKDFDPEEHREVLRRAGLPADGNGSSADTTRAPTVDVFLPVCNEPLLLLANTWNHVQALDYPRVTVHVLDDGAKDEVRALAAEYGFECEWGEHRCFLSLKYVFKLFLVCFSSGTTVWG